MRPLTIVLLPILSSTASAAETHLTIAEWAPPKSSNEPWQCVTENIPSYITNAPKVTDSALDSALFSYEKQLYATCTATRDRTGPLQPCPDPPRSVICSFSSAAPTSLLSAYSAYASSAASWWSAGNGDAVVSLVAECPWLWWDTLIRFPGTGANINRTVEHAQCFAMAQKISKAASLTLPGPYATSNTMTRTIPAGATPTNMPTSAPTKAGARGRAAAADSVVVTVMAMGVAVVAHAGL